MRLAKREPSVPGATVHALHPSIRELGLGLHGYGDPLTPFVSLGNLKGRSGIAAAELRPL